MAMIKIGGKEYDTEALSDESKNQLLSIQFVDSELARIRAQTAALQTARLAYGRALKESLESGSVQEQEEIAVEGLGETISFD